MISMFISRSSRAAAAPLCAGMPLGSCAVAASLAVLFDRRRTVVPFPFLTVAISCKNLLAKNRTINVPVNGYRVLGAGPRGRQTFHKTPAVRSREEIGRPLEYAPHMSWLAGGPQGRRPAGR